MDISEEIKIASTGSRIAPSNFFPLSYISLQKMQETLFFEAFFLPTGTKNYF